MNALSVRGLSKSFGANRVIDSISFDVPEGEIFGFLGANGAGKTTTMKMILGLLPADGGEVYVNNEKVTYGAPKTNRHVGYLPDVPQFYGYMRPAEYLKLCGEIAGLTPNENSKRAKALLEMAGLAGVNKRIAGFSRGMKQRLGMAQALLNEPKLLICDEPTSALDPAGRKEILDTLGRIKGRTTIIFSTHILSDVERICGRVAVLNAGRIALTGSLAELKAARRVNALYIEFMTPSDTEAFREALAPRLLRDAPAYGTELTLQLTDMEADGLTVLKALSEKGIIPLKLERLEPTMESLFLEVTK